MVDQIVLATPRIDGLTEPIIFCDNWYQWGGDENDIISRYYYAACKYHADPIVRITSDCPLILPEVIDKVIRAHFKRRAFLTFNRCDNSEGGWPDGLDVEVVDFKALQTAYVLAPADRREDFQWIHGHFRCHQVPCDKDYGPCTSINTQADYEKALEILGRRQNGSTSIG